MCADKTPAFMDFKAKFEEELEREVSVRKRTYFMILHSGFFFEHVVQSALGTSRTSPECLPLVALSQS